MRPILICLLWSTAIAVGGHSLAVAADELAEKLDTTLERHHQAQQLVGVSAAISKGGKPLWSGAAGMADLENQVPARHDMVHRIASISKSMTAVAVMQLVEKGDLSLDDTLRQRLPYFPKKRWPIRIRHLLSHTSGIRHYKFMEAGTATHYVSLKQAIGVFKDDPLKFEPGTDFGYSTFGYLPLGAIIEDLSGLEFGEYMKTHIWEPAGMSSSRLELRYEIVPRRSRGYMVKADGTFRNARHTDLSVKYPGGGMLSTAEDLVKFADAFWSGQLVSTDSRDQMLEVPEIDGMSTGYGLGFRSGQNKDLGKMFGHAGSQAGTRTMLLVFPDRGVAVAVICNREGECELPQLISSLATLAIAAE